MTPPESYVTPAIKELFKPQFATQDPDIYAVLLKDVAGLRRGPHPVAQGRSAAHGHDGDSRLLGEVKPRPKWNSRDSAAYDHQSLFTVESGSTHRCKSSRLSEQSGRNSTSRLLRKQVAVHRMASRPSVHWT